MKNPDEKASLEVLAFLPGDVPVVSASDAHIPLTFCMVVARYGAQFLYSYHGERLCWEFPAGGIEPGETPAECAIRELWEETAQLARTVTCCGLLKVRFPPPNETIEFCAVYRTELQAQQPHIPNPESLRIAWVLSPDDLDSPASLLSRAVLRWV